MQINRISTKRRKILIKRNRISVHMISPSRIDTTDKFITADINPVNIITVNNKQINLPLSSLIFSFTSEHLLHSLRYSILNPIFAWQISHLVVKWEWGYSQYLSLPVLMASENQKLMQVLWMYLMEPVQSQGEFLGPRYSQQIRQYSSV